jgi:hypothetical protein
MSDSKALSAPINNPVNAIQIILSSGTTAAQANLLLELTEHLSEGKAVSSVVSDVCRVRASVALRSKDSISIYILYIQFHYVLYSYGSCPTAITSMP